MGEVGIAMFLTGFITGFVACAGVVAYYMYINNIQLKIQKEDEND